LSWADRVADAVAATVKITGPRATSVATGPGVPAPGGASTATGSAVLVAPTVLATTENVVGSWQPYAPGGGAPFAAGWVADSGSRLVALRQLLYRTTTGPDVGTATALRVVLIALDAPIGVDGVEIDWRRPRVGTRIAVVGHSYRDARVPLTALEAAFGNIPRGEKFVVPGEVVDVDADTLRYEAFTTAGMAGGPVVDLDSGLVIGIHLGGQFADGVKYGFAIPMVVLQHELRPLIEQLRLGRRGGLL
jgi:hypothetical protein